MLGPLEVRRSGRAVPLGGPRQRAVLALLLLEVNRAVSMDRLAEDVWDGDPPEGWVSTVKTYVFHLRQALEPGRSRGGAGGVLVTSGRGYLLRAGREQVDAARFEDGFTAGRAALDAGRPGEAAQTLRQALGLWRGPVLADLAECAFTRPEAARLEELRLATVEARIDADLALGRHDALTGELEQLAGEHPLRERLHAQLMLALYRCGRQADALAAYRRARDLLAGDLGIDPGEPLQRLHAAVLAHDPALDWNGARQDAADGDRPGTPVTPAEPGLPGVRPTDSSGGPGGGRRRARRLLAAGSALAVAAAVSIVVAARPWAGGPSGLPANSVGLIASAGGRVGQPVSVGSPDGLAYGDGSVWAVDTTEGTLSRINPATHAVIQQIPVGSAPAAVTVTGQDVWVTNSGDGTVSRINAAANAVVAVIPVGNLPVAIARGPSGVWVANEGDDTVDRISPATGTVTMRNIPVGGLPDGIAVARGAVWVANGQDGTITRIDPVTGQPSGPIFVGSGPEGIAVTPAAVWVANSLDLTVSKIDPATSRVTDTIGVGDGPTAIAPASDGLWVSDEFSATLDRIDPRSDKVERVIPVGSSPRGIVASGSGIWVAARPFAAASHRGGTLTVVSKELPVQDPTQAGLITDVSALAPVYDGLVTLRKSGGAPGLTLVPDLATTLPRPTDGGTTYTFTLHRGIRYSNGALVRASDVRRGIQRELSFGVSAGYYEGILGGHTCLQHPKRCAPLSAGIVTNDPERTVTFHLAQADPEFPYKLALLLAAPAPPGTPNHPINGPPFLPGTGPYMISKYRPNASLTLARNPYFRQWSYAAQPAGYPSAIRFEQVASAAQQQSAVIAGRADLVNTYLNGQANDELAARYPTRTYAGLKVFTDYLFLNTRHPPFSNIKARRAVNYAIDRARMLQLLHRANGQAVVTCQILPADFPGHQAYCPYTAGAKNGVWHSPDIEKARQLVQESHTANTPVTVWTIQGLADRGVGSYLVRMLNDLGYRARWQSVPLSRFDDSADLRNNVQMGLFAWGADFPAAGGFFFSVLSCTISNIAQFCDPRADKLASKAQAEELTDPAAARTLWAQVDRTITNQAPWVPVIDESPVGFVSSRVGNYQMSPGYADLIDQMWVR